MNSNIIAEQYNMISKRFDTSRVKIWNNVKNFIQDTDIKQKKFLFDAGCGNGKNAIYALSYNYNVHAIDISENLIQISRNKGITVQNKNILDIDYENIFDKCICIAVIHHISSIELQTNAIVNLINSLKIGGQLLISVWSYEKNNIFDVKDNAKNDYRDFVKGDNYIDWVIDKKENVVIKRYYYIHDYVSFKNMMNVVKIYKSIDYKLSWEKQNWFCKIIRNA